MKLLIGLGNPGARYIGTRHNVGFAVLDHLVSTHKTAWRQSSRFKAHTAELVIHGQRVFLVKPTTYYNNTGESARAVMDFYKISVVDTLIIHDDTALNLGTIRTRIGGSDGGNNGLKSLETHIGSGTARLRIGVWTETLHGIDKTVVVLGNLSSDEQKIFGTLLPVITSIVEEFTKNNFPTTTHT